MPKIKRTEVVRRREKIPRLAKNNISVEEINMIKEVLQKDREFKQSNRKKERKGKVIPKDQDSSVKVCQNKEQIRPEQNRIAEKDGENENIEIGSGTKVDRENYSDKESFNKLAESGLSHFMNLEERKDLLMCHGEDPLSINGPEPFDSIDWVSVKQEVPDDVEVSQVTFTEIPLKPVEELGTFTSLPMNSTFPPSPILDASDERTLVEKCTVEKDDKCDENKDFKADEIHDDSWWSNDKEDGNCDSDSSEAKNDKSKLSVKRKTQSLIDIKSDEIHDDSWWSNDKEEGSSDSDSSEAKNDKPKLSVKRKTQSLHGCDICNKKLSSKGSLRLHKHKKHQITTLFKCELCSFQFDTHRDLIKHRKEAHRGKDGKFMCDDCGVKRNYYRNFVNHVKTHLKDVRVLSDLDNDGNKDANFACKMCDKVFNSEEELYVHRNVNHNSNDGVKGEKFKQLEKNYVCHTCGKRFAFGCLLRDHINLHTGTKPYLCQVCGRSFSQKASLKQHARTHNSVRPFQCTFCTQGFFGKGDLKKHMRKHTGERPYVCEMCGDGFSQSSHLGVHRRSHTGERPFKCDVCSRGFTKKGDVVRHRRIHTGELPYLCQVCGRAFRQSTQCVNHIKNHHPDAPVNVSKNPAPVSQWSF